MKLTIRVAVAVLCLLPASAFAVDVAESAAWREDLRVMAREMEARHKNLYHSVSRETFQAEVAKLYARIPTLERHQIIVELQRIVALVGDGHTNIYPSRDAVIAFHELPVRMYFFEDHLYVRAAAPEQASLVGREIVKFGTVGVDEAYARVRALVGRDNEMDARYFAPVLLAMPEVLDALGMSSELTLSDGKTVTLSAAKLVTPAPADTDLTWQIPAGWTDARGSESPLWLREPEKIFRMTMLPGTRALYVRLNQINDEKDETLAQFSERMRATIAKEQPEKLIVDLRLNRGGHGDLLQPFVRAIVQSMSIDQRGKLFVLIGRSTFSAAQFLVNDLETWTNATFIGEPSGSKANTYGDSRKIILSNSGITVRVSVYWWQRGPFERLEWSAPSVAAPLTFDAYRHNVDPALDAALHFTPGDPLETQLAGAFKAGGIDAARARFSEWKGDARNRWIDVEEQLLLAAYATNAIELFRFATEQFPRSSLARYHLADAYRRAGDVNAARREANAALELEPDSRLALDLLASLP